MLTARSRRRLRAARAGEDGMTLMELVVAMAVASLLAVMAGYFFIGTSTSSTAATERSLQTSQAREALQQWTQLIRVATNSQITSLASTGTPPTRGSTTLTFTADLGNRSGTNPATGTSTVALTIDVTNGVLTQTVTTAAGTATSSILVGCTQSSTNYCVSKGGVVGGQLSLYYPPTGCYGSALTSAGLCTYDAAGSVSQTHAVAVGISFTVDGVAGREHATAQNYSTVVAIGSAS